jgi:hypothetical protein
MGMGGEGLEPSPTTATMFTILVYFFTYSCSMPSRCTGERMWRPALWPSGVLWKRYDSLLI